MNCCIAFFVFSYVTVFVRYRYTMDPEEYVEEDTKMRKRQKLIESGAIDAADVVTRPFLQVGRNA